MSNTINHFRTLSRTLESGRQGYLAESKHLREQIEATQAAITHKENDSQNASKEREALRRLKKERSDLQAPSAVDPLPDVEQYAKTHSRETPAAPVEVKIPNGQTPLAVHNNLQEKTNYVLADIQRVISAPTTDIDIAAKVDAIATPPRIAAGEIVWPKRVGDSGNAVTNTEGLFAWLHRDKLIEALTVAQTANPHGMTAADKARELETLFGHFTKALRQEAAAAMAAEAAGQRVIRRRHVHPAVLLGLMASPSAVWDWFSKKRGA